MSEIILTDIPVMYSVALNGPAGAKDAFDIVEDAIKRQLSGRRLYGTLQGDEYRANVAIVDGENPEELGLLEGLIPGGKYLRRKIPNWEDNTDLIGPTFVEMQDGVEVDLSRPFIEFYRSQAELQLLVPLK